MHLIPVHLIDNQRMLSWCDACKQKIDSYHGKIYADTDREPVTFYHEACVPVGNREE